MQVNEKKKTYFVRGTRGDKTLRDVGMRGMAMPDTGHHGRKSAVPIVRIKFGHNEQRKSSLLGGKAGWSFDRSSYRVIERRKWKPEYPENLDR